MDIHHFLKPCSHLWWNALPCHFNPHVCGLSSLSSWLYVWFLICGFVQVLFLSLVGNFECFNSHCPLTALELDLFSCTYFNTFLWCPVIENDSIQMVHQVLWLKIELDPSSEMPCFFKELDNGQSTKKEVSLLHSCCALSFQFFDPCPRTSVRVWI